ncbi:MAG: DUF340 domain-containing protein [Candidatus Cloacimonadota bacterium]|nr:MAG: DUF340 domain-containing protein [Candidatus Cloacimonadota bacterium]
MIIVISILSGGILCGFVFRKKKNVAHYAGISMNIAIYMLLFLLGVSVGANDAIIKAIGNIGFMSLVLAGASVAGSVLVSWLSFVLFFSKNK